MVYTRYKIGYQSGEYPLLKRLQKEGWIAYRTAGSKGERSVDIIAIKKDKITDEVIIRFIQSKVTKDEKRFEKPLSLLTKKEKEELKYLCELFRNYPNIRVELYIKLRYTKKKKFIDLKKALLEE